MALAALAWWAWPGAPAGTPAAAPTTQAFPWDKVPAQVAEPAVQVPDATQADTSADAKVPVCATQALRLHVGGEEAMSACVSRTLVHQNGSVRSFEVQSENPQGWSLKVAIAGQRVTSVQAHNGAGDTFACAGGDGGTPCTAVSLSRADRRGERRLTLADLMLTSSAPRAAALRVSASLLVPTDDQIAGLACHGPSVFVGAADGARQKFCAQGGAGIEFGDDGKLRIEFHNLEGEALSVALDAQGELERVEFGPYACAGRACSGVSTSVADGGDPLAERQFFFGHTVLTRTGTTSSQADTLSLDGNLTLAAQQ